MTQQPMANAVSRLSMCVLLLMVGSVEAAELPSDLDAVPRNAAMFVHVRAADIWNHELLQDTRYLLSQAGPQAIKRFRDMFAPDVATIDRVTLVWQSIDAMGGWFPNGDPTQESAVTIIHTKRPYDFSRVTSKVGLRDKFHRRKHYFFNEESWSGMVLLDRQTIAIGSEEAIFRFLDARETADSQGPLQFALELAAGKAHLTFGFNPKVLSDAGLLKVVPPSLQGMFMAKWWAGSLSLGKPLEARISFSYHQAKDAETGEKAVRAALELVRTQLLSDIQNMERLIGRDKEKVTFSDLPERFAILLGLGFFRELDRLLKTAPIQRTGETVAIHLQYDRLSSQFSTAILSVGLLGFGVSVNSTFRAVGAANPLGEDPRQLHLSKIARAMEAYRRDKGTYPPPAIYDREGRPMLSWRVALLPYLGEKALYAQFRLDEPWDSEHNKQLLKRMPQCYRAPDSHDWRAPWKTRDVVFTGKHTIFEGPQGIKGDDVNPRTILLALVPVESAVAWTKPDGDPLIEAGKPVPDLSGNDFVRTNYFVLLVDGTFKAIEPGMDDKKLRSMIFRKKVVEKPEPPPSYPEAAWRDFIFVDDRGSRRAFAGIRHLASQPEIALPFLRKHLAPAKGPDPARVQQLINDLDSSDFKERELATQTLARIGFLALPSLKKKLAEKSLPLEMHKRLRRLADQIQSQPVSSHELREVRAIRVLQLIGNQEAKTLLQQLARGADGALITEHARRALSFLDN